MPEDPEKEVGHKPKAPSPFTCPGCGKSDYVVKYVATMNMVILGGSIRDNSIEEASELEVRYIRCLLCGYDNSETHEVWKKYLIEVETWKREVERWKLENKDASGEKPTPS